MKTNQNEAEKVNEMCWGKWRADKNRPLDDDAVYWIRLWYLGSYRGAKALRTLTVRQIGRILHRSEEQIRMVLAPYERSATHK